MPMGMKLPKGRSSRLIVVVAVASSMIATTPYINIKNSIKNQNSALEAVPLKSKVCLIPSFTALKNIDMSCSCSMFAANEALLWISSGYG